MWSATWVRIVLLRCIFGFDYLDIFIHGFRSRVRRGVSWNDNYMALNVRVSACATVFRKYGQESHDLHLLHYIALYVYKLFRHIFSCIYMVKTALTDNTADKPRLYSQYLIHSTSVMWHLISKIMLYDWAEIGPLLEIVIVAGHNGTGDVNL